MYLDCCYKHPVMFYTKLDKTTDFQTALSWHQQGEVVLVDGWVKATRAGKEKLWKNSRYKRISFTEVVQHHPKWKITTQKKEINRAPIGDFTALYGYNANKEKERVKAAKKLQAIDMKEVREAAKTMTLPKKKRNKMIKKGLIPKSRNREKRFSTETRLEKLTWIESRFENLKEKWEREGKDTKTITLYHGTKLTNINSIFATGFRIPSHSGMLGRGIYLGQRNKARDFSDGLVLICEVMLGDCKELKDIEHLDRNQDYDSMHLPKGSYGKVYKGFLRNEEWVVRHPSQVRIIGVLVKGP